MDKLKQLSPALNRFCSRFLLPLLLSVFTALSLSSLLSLLSLVSCLSPSSLLSFLPSLSRLSLLSLSPVLLLLLLLLTQEHLKHPCRRLNLELNCMPIALRIRSHSAREYACTSIGILTSPTCHRHHHHHNPHLNRHGYGLLRMAHDKLFS